MQELISPKKVDEDFFCTYNLNNYLPTSKNFFTTNTGTYIFLEYLSVMMKMFFLIQNNKPLQVGGSLPSFVVSKIIMT